MDIEITRYSDRLEVISPGALPNGMTVEKVKAGRRIPRNPIILEVLRDYGYVDARGMGVRTKVILLTRQFTGMDPLFEASEDYLKTVIRKGAVTKNVPENAFQGHLLDLIRSDPRITYNELAVQTRRDRKTVQRHLKVLKEMGLVRRIGPAKGGFWEVVES